MGTDPHPPIPQTHPSTLPLGLTARIVGGLISCPQITSQVCPPHLCPPHVCPPRVCLPQVYPPNVCPPHVYPQVQPQIRPHAFLQLTFLSNCLQISAKACQRSRPK